MKISKNFSLSEFTKSETADRLGIDNSKVSESVIENLKMLVNTVLQPLRDSIGKPIHINSGYRCLKLNNAVNGVPTSQHVIGQASDIKVIGMKPIEVAKHIVDLELEYDQLIVYDTFCHISVRKHNRKQLLYNKSYTGQCIEI